MPVRKITKSHRSVIGRVMGEDGEVHQSESTLERDFLVLLRFDLQVERFETQPCSIPYLDPRGVKRTYTPDVLVKYRRDILPACKFSPLLCEIKYKDDLAENATRYEHKFEVARNFAYQKGWTFRVLTEHDIRTPYLDNARFLTPYKRVPYDHERAKVIKEALFELRQTTPRDLLSFIAHDKWTQASLMPNLWQLIVTYEICTDLESPLTMKSELWLEDC